MSQCNSIPPTLTLALALALLLADAPNLEKVPRAFLVAAVRALGPTLPDSTKRSPSNGHPCTLTKFRCCFHAPLFIWQGDSGGLSSQLLRFQPASP